MSSHPDAPGFSGLSKLRRQSTHSTPPSTATRCQYKQQLTAIAKELANKQQSGVEDALRAAVHSFVLLEAPQLLTPTGTILLHSTGADETLL